MEIRMTQKMPYTVTASRRHHQPHALGAFAYLGDALDFAGAKARPGSGWSADTIFVTNSKGEVLWKTGDKEYFSNDHVFKASA
jgi:hypothetical protein